jgi:chemotaxis receptor (MCP) glutamine deamidase CheD
MVPAIGVMIAAYIITRMLEMLASEGKMVIKVFGCATILVTLVSVVDILNAGSHVAGLR